MFLSHTSELREHPPGRSFVAAAEAAVLRAGHAVTDMAYFAARDSEPADYCVRMVESADVYVGIIGHRHGAAVRGWPDVSYTELEFDTATTLGLPRLIFLLDDGSRSQERQEAFRARLQQAGVTVARVASPADLEIGLHQSLVDLRVEAGTQRSAARRGRRRPRPTSPSHRDASRIVAFWMRMDQPELGDAIALLREQFGMTRGQLIDRMWEVSEDGEDLGVDGSLVYRWEVGEKGKPRPRPTPRYRLLLGRVCDREVEQLDPIARREFLRQLAAVVAPPLLLGLPGQGGEAWTARTAASHTFAPVGLTADDVGELTSQYERLRRRVSGAQLLGPVRAHVDFVARYLRDTSLNADARPPLISAMGEAAVLAGRLSFWDLHDEAAARHYFEMAGDAARESGDRALSAYALAFRAELSTYVKQPERALRLSRTAQEQAEGAASPRVRSWLAAVEAEAAAHVNDVDGCVRALGRAREAMDRAGAADEDPPWIEFFDQARLAGYAGACLVRIGHSEALPVLRHAAKVTDPMLRRYQSEIAADLAWALAREGEVEESCRLLEGAYEAARAVGYRDGLRRVFGVRQELDVVGRVPAIAALDDRLRHGWVS